MSKTIGLEKISKRYAEALFAIADKNGSEAKVQVDLTVIKEVFEQNEQFRMFMDHPSVDPVDKKKALEKLFKTNICEETNKLLMLLLEKGRLNVAPTLHSYFKELVFKKQNIDVAKLSSAKELTSAQVEEIKTRLEKIFAKKLELETHIDESLIAGIKVNVGDKVLDSSVKSKLKQMRQLLSA